MLLALVGGEPYLYPGVFMEWINKIDEICVVNLTKRDDRLLEFAKQMEEYEIPFKRVSAIENPKGAEGLRDTMKRLFEDCIEKKFQHVLVFEDDALFVVPSSILHDTMNKVMGQLPPNYFMLFLGCQITGCISHYHSPNIIQASKMFSTHAVLYSLQGMKEILAHGFDYPIDNYYTAEIEPMRNSYCTYPLLASQREGYSDICQNPISWRPFIEARFEQKIGEFNGGKQW